MGVVLATEDFEGYTAGAPPPPPWDVVPSTGGQIDVETDPAVGGARGLVLRVFDNSASDHSTARWAAFPAESARFILEFKIYLVSGADVYVGAEELSHFGGGDTPGDRPFILSFRGGTIYYYTDIGQEASFSRVSTGLTYVTGQWMRVRFDYSRAVHGNDGNEQPAIRRLEVEQPLGGAITSVTDLDAGGNSWNFIAINFSTKDADSGTTFYLDDLTLAAYHTAVSGIARQADGHLAGGATLILLRESDHFELARTTAAANGTFSVNVATGDFNPVSCSLLTRHAKASDGASVRAHLQIL